MVNSENHFFWRLLIVNSKQCKDRSSANEIISDKEMSQTEEESVDYDEFTIETQDVRNYSINNY